MQHNCSNCGNPTRSHELCGDYFCHDCVMADGGLLDGGDAVQNWFDKGPRVEKFKKFHRAFIPGMPDDYTPHYFKVQPGSKVPVMGISWKTGSGRLTFEEAVEWMENGGNVGLAGLEDDCLINQDIDGGNAPSVYDVKPTLTIRSRSREPETGHNFYREADGADIPNINTAESGEIRCGGEYVVAAGSYVPPEPVQDLESGETLDEAFPDGVYEADVPDDEVEDAGYYTVEIENEVAEITLRELPTVFIEQVAWSEYQQRNREERDTFDPETVESNGEKSAVFDVRTSQIVTGGDRSTDPNDRWTALFHNSETSANMSVSDEGLLHCWRHGVAHGPLQALAVLSDEGPSGQRGCSEVGKGHKGGSNGRCELTGGELAWPAWKYAKKTGLIPEADKIPSSALVHVATKDGIVDQDDIIDGWKIPGKQYAEAIEHVEDTYRVNTGRQVNRVAYDEEDDLPPGVATFLPDIGEDESKTGVSRKDLHRLTEDQINNVMKYEREVCVDSIMTSGKTYSSFKMAYERNEKMAYFAPRIDLYEQAKGDALDVGFSEDEIFVAPSITQDCPTYRGDNRDKWDGKEWGEIVRGQYHADAGASDIHEHHDNIVCSPSDDDNDNCPYQVAMSAYDPDQHKVVIGHFTHAHLPQLTTGRHLVFDEKTSGAFATELAGEDLIEAVNAFLSMDGSPPADTFTDLLQARNDPRREERISGWFNKDNLKPDKENALKHYDEGFNAYAPLAVYTILKASPVEEGSAHHRCYIDAVDTVARFFSTDDQHGEYEVAIRDRPNLSKGNSIIALDGTPLVIEDGNFASDVPEKSGQLGVTLEHEKILSDEERAEYVEHTLNHRYIQTSQALKPYSSGKYNNPTEDKTLLHGVTEQYGDGDPPVVFTSKKVADECKAKGFVEDGVAEEIAHTGSLRGTNKYSDTRLGAQLGSSHHGDHEIAIRAAWLNEGIDPSGRGHDRDYGSELGNKILEQMREQTTLQNVLRFGRDGQGATIILHTAAFPDWLPIYAEGRVAPWSDGQREVVTALDELFISSGTSLTVNEIHDHDAVSTSKETVRSSLKQLKDDHELVSSRDDPDDERRQLWMDEGVTDLEEAEQAEIDLPDMDDETLESMGLLADDGTPKVSKAQITRYNISTSDSGEPESESGQTAPDDGECGDGGGSDGDSGVSGGRSGS